MVSVLPCKVTVTFFILLSNEIVCSKSLVRSDMNCFFVSEFYVYIVPAS